MSSSVDAVERFFKVLADNSRLRIVHAVSSGERSVSEIIEQTGLSQTLASFHLRVLREAGVLNTERRGPFIYYRLVDPSLLNLLEACGRYAESMTDGKSAQFRWPPWAAMCRVMASRRR